MDKKQVVVSNMAWKFMERIIAKGITLLVTILLARILLPEDYSVISVVTIFFAFSNILIAGGFNTALIQKKNADKEDYSSVLFVTLLTSIIIYIIFFFCAPLIANLFSNSQLISIIRVMGLILPVTAVNSVICAYVSANLQFRKFFFSTIIGTIISAIVGIYMALHNYGPWALVAQQMTNTIIDTVILCFTSKMRITFKIKFKKLKDLFSYGWKILASQFIGTMYSEINPLIIGMKFSPADLAYFTKGRSFPALISTTTTESLSAVLFPVLSDYKDDLNAILRYTRQFISTISYIVFPIMMGLLIVAPAFVSVILTDKWLPMVPFLQIFCITYMFDMIHIGNCESIKAIGRSDIYLKMEIVKKVCYFTTIILFLVFSDSPIILTISELICTLIALIVNTFPNKKLIGYKTKYQISDLLPNLLISGIMMLCVYLVGFIKINTILLLLLQIFVGIVVYFILSVITKNKNFYFILNFIKSHLGKRGEIKHE